MEIKKNDKKRAGRWYEKYLPFIARSRKKQIEWLTNCFRKKTLSFGEITPYVKLLLEEDDPEGEENLRELLEELPKYVLTDLLSAADIYDAAKLLEILPEITVEHAVIALKKTPPPYEPAPQSIIDRIFQVLHEKSDELLASGANQLSRSDEAPEHFVASYRRFQEILKDQEFLSTLYPKARN